MAILSVAIDCLNNFPSMTCSLHYIISAHLALAGEKALYWNSLKNNLEYLWKHFRSTSEVKLVSTSPISQKRKKVFWKNSRTVMIDMYVHQGFFITTRSLCMTCFPVSNARIGRNLSASPGKVDPAIWWSMHVLNILRGARASGTESQMSKLLAFGEKHNMFINILSFSKFSVVYSSYRRFGYDVWQQ